MYTTDGKTGVIDMISTVGADKNVAEILIHVTSDNKWNDQILKLIRDRYTNVYDLYIID